MNKNFDFFLLSLWLKFNLMKWNDLYTHTHTWTQLLRNLEHKCWKQEKFNGGVDHNPDGWLKQQKQQQKKRPPPFLDEEKCDGCHHRHRHHHHRTFDWCGHPKMRCKQEKKMKLIETNQPSKQKQKNYEIGD